MRLSQNSAREKPTHRKVCLHFAGKSPPKQEPCLVTLFMTVHTVTHKLASAEITHRLQEPA